MATKKTVTRRGSDKREKAKTIVKLSLRAQAEVAKLLKRNQTGPLTRVELNTELKKLNTGLKKVERLGRMLNHINKVL
jgi:hypothetical protein